MRSEHLALADEMRATFQRLLQASAGPPDYMSDLEVAGIRHKAERFISLNYAAAQAVKSGAVGAAPINEPHFLHFFWILSINREATDQFLDVLIDDVILKRFPLTKYLTAYAKSMAVFSGRSVSLPPEPRPSRYEIFWQPYLNYMLGRCGDADFTHSARASFDARNGQLRFIDWYSLDGYAKKPVRWDMRYESIKRKRA